jgi:hypothetical protein
MLVMLALLSAQAIAYDVAIKVTVSQGTLAVGTNVTIVKDGVALYNAKAGADGVASFQLDPGSYFILLDRGGYPRYVSILEVSGKTNVTRTMSQGMSFSAVYGQVAGVSDFSGVSIGAFMDGKIVDRVSPNKDGYYLMLPLQAGNYEFEFTASGYAEKKAALALSTAVFSELNAVLEKPAPAQPEQPKLIAPDAAEQKTVIEVLLARGSLPMAGEKITVQTPSGTIEATTGEDGKARVNAVQAGTYRFSYGSLAAATKVAGAALPSPEPQVVNPEQQPQPVQAAPQDNGGHLAAFAVFGVLGLMAFVAAAIFLAARAGKKHHKKHGAHVNRSDEPPHQEHMRQKK